MACDAVYNGTHAVIAGHKNPANDDNPQHIGATRKYIRDFNRLNHQTTTVRELCKTKAIIYEEQLH